MFSIDSLNDLQRQIAIDTEGAKLVTAGAGSGKTRLLTHRICYLIDEKNISPSNILAITFTNKATNEMRERISQMISNASGITIKTFPSFSHIPKQVSLKLNFSFSNFFPRVILSITSHLFIRIALLSINY